MSLSPKSCFMAALLFAFSNQFLYGQTKLEQLEKKWQEGKYEEVIPELTEYAEKTTSQAILLRIDYMLGTSMCRLTGSERDGYRLLELIPYIYRHISPYNYELVLNEKRSCIDPAPQVARLSFEPPSVSGKGGIEMISPHDLSMSQQKFAERLREYDSRLHRIDSGPPQNLETLARMAGEDYTAISHGHFIVVGKFAESGLEEKAQLLENTLRRFVQQFNMEMPVFYTTVYLVPEARDLVDFANENHDIDIPSSMWGYTFAYDCSIVIRTSGGIGTVGHEIFHTLLNHNFPESPPWLNEGYSALFEEFKWQDGSIAGTFRDDHWRIRYLHSDPENRPSVAELMGLDWNKLDATDPELLHINHTTAKFFTMYLQNKRNKLEEVYQAFQNINFRQGTISVADEFRNILEEVLGQESEEIERDFQQWLADDLAIHK